MENENKNLQNEETVLTPQEKVQADISSKIADAAAEVKDEILNASDNAENEVLDIADEIVEDVQEFAEDIEDTLLTEPEKKLTRNSFIASLVGAALIGAIIAILIFTISGNSKDSNASLLEKATVGLMDTKDDSSVVITVGDRKITDTDLAYYINAEASTYANENSLTEDVLATYDWEQEIDGVKLSEKIKDAAVEAAITDALTIQKGLENNIVLDEAAQYSIMSQIYGMLSSYGKDGLILRFRTMGIPSIEQYAKMYEYVMLSQEVSADIDANPANYYPEDISSLNDYIQPDKASVKHILISTEAPEAAEGEEAAAPVDKKALAQEVLQKAQAGEDFDALVAQYNEDPGATETGYTFTKGTMVAAFEDAAFALKIGEISDIVETEYGYHIIKRIPGLYELQGMWKEDAKVNVKKSAVKKLSVSEIMNDMVAAISEVNAAQAQ